TLSRLIRTLGLSGPQAAAFQRAGESGSRRRSPVSAIVRVGLEATPAVLTPNHPPGLATAPGGERRQLTLVMCAMTVGSAPETERDPEELAEVLSAGHEVIAQLVSSHEGRVVRIIGGDLVASFGYPVAHEDDPSQAVRAGL